MHVPVVPEYSATHCVDPSLRQILVHAVAVRDMGTEQENRKNTKHTSMTMVYDNLPSSKQELGCDEGSLVGVIRCDVGERKPKNMALCMLAGISVVDDSGPMVTFMLPVKRNLAVYDAS